MQVVPHADSKPVADLPSEHRIQDPEHLTSGEAQTLGVICLVVKVRPDVEVVPQVGLDDLLVN